MNNRNISLTQAAYRNTLIEIRALIQNSQANLSDIATRTASLSVRHRVGVPPSIFSSDSQMSSIPSLDRDSISVVSDREFAFDQQLLNTQRYQREPVHTRRNQPRGVAHAPVGHSIDLRKDAEVDITVRANLHEQSAFKESNGVEFTALARQRTPATQIEIDSPPKPRDRQRKPFLGLKIFYDPPGKADFE